MSIPKRILETVAALVIGGAVGSGITLAIKDNGNTPGATSNAAKTSVSSTVYDPSTILKNSQAYIGQTVSIKGKLGKGGTSSTYYLIGTGTKPAGIRVDFSKSGINPSKYFTSASKGALPAAAKAMIFKGVVNKDKSGLLYLSVSSAV